jgi:hypothetical protein
MLRLCVLVLSLALSSLAHATQYTLTDLGPVIVTAIDPAVPVVVGSYYMPRQIAAIVYPQPVVLGTLPGGEFSVANFTRSGLTVGYCGTGQFSSFTHACAHTPVTGLEDLGTLGDPSLFSAATGCNSFGMVVGYGEDAGHTRLVPILWIGDQPQVLRTPTDQNAFAQAINDACYIVGSALDDDGTYHAALWSCGGGYWDLGTSAQGMAINNSDGAVLVQETTPTAMRAAIFRSDGKHPLAPLPGDHDIWPGGLNDFGVAVGTSILPGYDFPSTVSQPVLWQADDTPVALIPLVVNAAGWTLEEARDINNQGLIVGEGKLSGVRHGFLLTPVENVTSVAPVVPATAVALPVDEMPLPVVLATMQDETVLAMAMRQHPRPAPRRHHR